jgi:hypothetical protein
MGGTPPTRPPSSLFPTSNFARLLGGAEESRSAPVPRTADPCGAESRATPLELLLLVPARLMTRQLGVHIGAIVTKGFVLVIVTPSIAPLPALPLTCT